MGALLLAASACTEATPVAQLEPRAKTGPLVVYTVNEPLRYFAARIGGPHVEALLPAPDDVDPAFWLPEPEDVVGYQGADLILRSGGGYARWIGFASLPRSTQVDTSAGYRDRLIALRGSVTHSHGPQAAQSHGDTAFTTWLDLELAAQQARAVGEAFADARPLLRSDFEIASAKLVSDLERLDERLLEIGAAYEDESLLFSHPVYQYLQQRYGLGGDSLHWEPDQDPGPDEWGRLSERQARSPARWMLWEAEPLPETQRRLGELGITPIVFSPGGNAVEGVDWLALMNANADRLEAAIRRD
jgi:zinc transport system substrate-binding protein